MMLRLVEEQDDVEAKTYVMLQAGTEETWVYPSQQMFFNALLRKGGGW